MRMVKAKNDRCTRGTPIATIARAGKDSKSVSKSTGEGGCATVDRKKVAEIAKTRHSELRRMSQPTSANLDIPPLVSGGFQLSADPETFGLLRDSSDAIDSVENLRARMASDGYLYLPGYLNRDEVLDARREVTRRLAEQGCLD